MRSTTNARSWPSRADHWTVPNSNSAPHRRRSGSKDRYCRPSLSRARQRLLRCRQMTNSPPRGQAWGGFCSRWLPAQIVAHRVRRSVQSVRHSRRRRDRQGRGSRTRAAAAQPRPTRRAMPPPRLARPSIRRGMPARSTRGSSRRILVIRRASRSTTWPVRINAEGHDHLGGSSPSVGSYTPAQPLVLSRRTRRLNSCFVSD